ncbi:MAG: HD domain-containing protein [Polaromonas sp.]|nr:HD domain-containing protein [Polaromonas sp.]
MFIFPTTGMREAHRFADLAHAGQVRKYVGRPYIEHPVAVARLVMRFEHDEAMVMAGLLHDVKEDCGVTDSELVRLFGSDVAGLVDDLSDVSRPEDGNRAARKAIDLAHTAAAKPRAKSIKAADLTHNSMSIVRHGGAFAPVYLAEKARVLAVLGDASEPRLVALAQRVHTRAMHRLQVASMRAQISISGGRRLVA